MYTSVSRYQQGKSRVKVYFWLFSDNYRPPGATSNETESTEKESPFVSREKPEYDSGFMTSHQIVVMALAAACLAYCVGQIIYQYVAPSVSLLNLSLPCISMSLYLDFHYLTLFLSLSRSLSLSLYLPISLSSCLLVSLKHVSFRGTLEVLRSDYQRKEENRRMRNIIREK